MIEAPHVEELLHHVGYWDLGKDGVYRMRATGPTGPTGVAYVHHDRDATYLGAQESDRIEEERKILASAGATGPAWDRYRSHHESQETERIRKHIEYNETAARRYESETYGKQHADEMRKRDLEIQAKIDQQTKVRMAEVRAAEEEIARRKTANTLTRPTEFPQTREAWEKFVHDYEKETKRLGKERRRRYGE